MPRDYSLKTNIAPYSSPPATTAADAGSLYYSTYDSFVYVSNGATWAKVGGGGTAWKEPVWVASTTNVTLSGVQTIDGSGSLGSGYRVLIKNQANPGENGIYITDSAGAWARAADAGGAAMEGAMVVVMSGNTQANTLWQMTADPPFVVGTTPLTWTQIAGSMILTGAGAPTASTGSPGNYYVDTTGDDLYGPRSAAGFGPEQRITVASAPNTTTTNVGGCRVTFGVAGRVTRVRYTRIAAASATQDIKVWDSGGTQVGATVPDTQSGASGSFEVTLPTPLAVAAGSTYTFSAEGVSTSRISSAQTATNTTDCTFVGHFFAATGGTFPNTSGGSSYYVEPIFQSDPVGTVWPLALETQPEVNISTAGPSPRAGELLWVDTDEVGGMYLDAVGGSGPWPQSYVVNTPFKADVLVNWCASGWATNPGVAGFQLQCDGVPLPLYADMYHNETSTHRMLYSTGIIRAQAAGNHTWTIALSGAITADANDRGRIAFTFMAVP